MIERFVCDLLMAAMGSFMVRAVTSIHDRIEARTAANDSAGAGGFVALFTRTGNLIDSYVVSESFDPAYRPSGAW